MNKFLLEVLVQELPYKFIPSAMAQLECAFKKLFEENSLSFGSLRVYATPRRLAVVVLDLANKKEDTKKEVRGPILTVALDCDGNYTNAALGFAKKNGIDSSKLYKKDNYIWAEILECGKDAKEILSSSIKDVILKLQGPHFMRWADNEEKFSRPIENILALFNDEVLPIEILGVKSTNVTKGHRFAKQKTVEIKDPNDYVEALQGVNVFVNPVSRKEIIMHSAMKMALNENLVINFDELGDLLEEVVYITEYPVPVLCSFDEKYLKIPDIVTTTVMSKHQRYFPLYKKDGKLSNKFITMANFVGEDEESFNNIKAGNQRVVSARLEDGIFFYNEDTKVSLEDKLNDLKGMTFQRNLGTLYDKTMRLIELSKVICEDLRFNNKDSIRAAKLCKADLSTSLVFEFTELQGFIGENYALKSGENDNVALAIKEHYFPLNAVSETPASMAGATVSIADKIDTITAVFLATQEKNKKKRPTGSNDPLGVRRAAIGILRTVINLDLNLDIEKLTELAIELISKEFDIEVSSETFNEIIEFITDRLFVMYEKSYENGILEACALKNPLKDISVFLKRADSVSAFVREPYFAKLYEVINRVIKITANIKIKDLVDTSLFTQEAETALYAALKKMPSITLENMEMLQDLIEPINNFFDNVLVMDKDEKIKNNRLALLLEVKKIFDSACDFSKVTYSKTEN